MNFKSLVSGISQPSRKVRRLVCSLVASLVMGTGVAHAALISFDLVSGSGGDPFTGAAVFGDAGTVWNTASRLSQPSNLALVGANGGASGVTLSYTRADSGAFTSGITGTYGNLLNSHVLSQAVVLSGLSASTLYDLVVYSNWNGTPAFLAGGITLSTDGQVDGLINALTAGDNYVRFSVQSSQAGTVSFLPLENPQGLGGGSAWSGFQLQSNDVPEPGSLALAGLALGLLVLARRRA